jgi:hypothetical protein
MASEPAYGCVHLTNICKYSLKVNLERIGYKRARTENPSLKNPKEQHATKMDDVKSVEDDVKIVNEESMQPAKMHIGKTWRCVCACTCVALLTGWRVGIGWACILDCLGSWAVCVCLTQSAWSTREAIVSRIAHALGDDGATHGRVG